MKELICRHGETVYNGINVYLKECLIWALEFDEEGTRARLKVLEQDERY